MERWENGGQMVAGNTAYHDANTLAFPRRQQTYRSYFLIIRGLLTLNDGLQTA
jgi:hypothetical protein